jgi:hypothetical protein
VGLFMCEAGEAIGQKFVQTASWELEIAGKRYPADVSIAPMYDPGLQATR